MNVLNVNMSLDPVTGGGTAERTLQISREMAKAGIKTVILTTDIGLTPEYKRSIKEIELITLPCLCKRFYIHGFSYHFIQNLVEHADIVNLMGHWTLINTLVYRAALKTGKPYTVCPAGALPVYGRSKLLKKFYNFIIGKEIIRNASACIAIAPNETSHFEEYGIDPNKIFLIPNGANNDNPGTGDYSGFREKYNLGNHPILLFMGRLNYIKGPDLLLRAFYGAKDTFGDYHLLFVGPDGGMLHKLQNMAVQFSLQDKIHFTGYLGGEDKAAAYHSADLLIIPSRQEAMSIVVLEAGMSGKPVLITDQCGFNDVAAVNGGMSVPASAEGIQSGLMQMLSDPQILQLMGKNLKKYVEINFNWKVAVNKYIQLYNKISAKKII